MFEEDDVYPALAMTRIFRDVWAEDFQIRVGLSDTVARPDLREISGSSFIDPLTETRIRGNPALVTSAISNFDLRAEWFFANGDNFTASLFYKDIENPIETVQAAGTDDNISLTFMNAESATISGRRGRMAQGPLVVRLGLARSVLLRRQPDALRLRAHGRRRRRSI